MSRENKQSNPQIAEDDGHGLVARVVSVNGVHKIEIDGKVFEALAFRSFRPEERNISEFYEAGIRLMSIYPTGMNCTLDVPYSKFGEIWTGLRQYDFAALDRQMELFLKCAPGAYFNIMLQLDTRDWYLRAHPECSNTYWNLVEMAGHAPWREDVAAYVQDVLRYIEGKYGERVFSYTIYCGSSNEWYTNMRPNFPEAAIREHPIKEACFRGFTGDPQAQLPPLEELHRTTHGVFRDPAADAPALRYWRFHHQIIGDAIVHFAGRAQEVLRHRKLLGIFYGYLTQLDGKRLLQEGQMGYERVWECPDLDMIFAPAKYGQPRSFEGASGFLMTVDSLRLHNKLALQEIDHTTYIAPSTVENGRPIPGSSSKLKDEFQTRMVLRREFALTRTKRMATWWFDFFGGYYYAEPLMKEVAKMIRIQDRLKDVPMRSVAQIAVFGDVESMYRVQAFSPLANDLLVQPPDELARIGAPYDIYNFSDLDHEHLPLDQYRLMIFLNPFFMPPEKRDFIARRAKSDGRTLLWLYAPNYIGESGFSTDAISSITGMAVAGRAGSDSAVSVAPGGMFARLGTEAHYSFSAPVTPLFEIQDREASPWGVYQSDGAVALASKKFPDHTSVYSAVGNLPAAIYREVARAAGVHIYHEGSDPVYVNNRLVGIHMQSGTEPVINLPLNRAVRLEELFDDGEISIENGTGSLPLEAGAAKLFLLLDAELACPQIEKAEGKPEK